MTFLQLVNAVMRRLREEQATTINESDYSVLIGDFVNDAKRMVEDAWDWKSLRSDFNVTTVAGTSTYTLSGSGNRLEILHVYDTTNNVELRRLSLADVNKYKVQTDDTNGTVMGYTVSHVDSNGDVVIKLHSTPDSVISLQVKAVLRPSELENDSDRLLVPSAPVIQYAYAFALRERGETGGQGATEQSAFARQELTNAIALDAALSPDELIWDTV
jgi:hypothetical protein